MLHVRDLFVQQSLGLLYVRLLDRHQDRSSLFSTISSCCGSRHSSVHKRHEHHSHQGQCQRRARHQSDTASERRERCSSDSDKKRMNEDRKIHRLFLLRFFASSLLRFFASSLLRIFRRFFTIWLRFRRLSSPSSRRYGFLFIGPWLGHAQHWLQHPRRVRREAQCRQELVLECVYRCQCQSRYVKLHDRYRKRAGADLLGRQLQLHDHQSKRWRRPLSGTLAGS